VWASRSGTRIVVYQGVRMCQNRREGRDSFEPRLVFASPCVPRTSYFNETVCPSLSLSLSYFLSFSSLSFFLSLAHLTAPPLCSFPLTISLVNQPTDRPVGLISHRPFLSLSLFLLLLLLMLPYRAIMHVSLSFPPLILVRLSKKASHRLRIRRTV